MLFLIKLKQYIMKTKLLAFSLFFSLFFIACKKDSNTTVVDTGTIRYNNASSGGNRYEIFLDGASLGLLSSGIYYDETDVPVGSHIVKAVQYEGFILSPTIKETTVDVFKGTTIQFDFP